MSNESQPVSETGVSEDTISDLRREFLTAVIKRLGDGPPLGYYDLHSIVDIGRPLGFSFVRLSKILESPPESDTLPPPNPAG